MATELTKFVPTVLALTLLSCTKQNLDSNSAPASPEAAVLQAPDPGGVEGVRATFGGIQTDENGALFARLLTKSTPTQVVGGWSTKNGFVLALPQYFFERKDNDLGEWRPEYSIAGAFATPPDRLSLNATAQPILVALEHGPQDYGDGSIHRICLQLGMGGRACTEPFSLEGP
jgi:hypothetical protein